jgi:hypothetical protein
MRAKFQCHDVVPAISGAEVAKLAAVYADGNPENNQFNVATPWATLEIGIDNPAAKGFFKPGESYYLDFTPTTRDTIESATASAD